MLPSLMRPPTPLQPHKASSTAGPQHTPDARPEQHSVADHRVAHALAGSRAAQSNVVQHGHIVAHNGCLANHDACGKRSDGRREGLEEGRGGGGAGKAEQQHAGQRAQGGRSTKRQPARHHVHLSPEIKFRMRARRVG